MGIQGGENVDTTFVQDIDVTFTLSGETDNGLTFGAAIDLDENAGAVGSDDAGVAIFVSGDFGTLTLGDTDGALDWALQDAGDVNPASINDDHTAHAGYNGNAQFDSNVGLAGPLAAGAALPGLIADALGMGFGDSTGPNGTPSATNSFQFSSDDAEFEGSVDTTWALGGYDGQILRYDYTVGGFGVAVSVQLDDDERLDPMWGIGARYAADFAGGSYSFGVGVQSGEIELIGTNTLDMDIERDWYDDDVFELEASAIADGVYGLGGDFADKWWVVTDFDGWGVSAGVELDSGFAAALSYTRHDIGNGGVEIDHVGVGIGYTMDAFSIGANWGQYDISGDLGISGDITGWGLAAAYDLGGGLSMHLGYGDGEVLGVDTDSSYSIGLNMAF